MDKNYILRAMLTGGATVGLLASGAAQAVDFNITGFVRQEIAISVTDDENPFNQSGHPYMGRVVPNTLLGATTAKGAPYDNGTFRNSIGNVNTNPNFFLANPIPPGGLNPQAGTVAGRMLGACQNANCGSFGTAAREENNFNMFATRAEIDIQAQWTDNIKTFVKFRAFGDAVSNFGDAFTSDLFRSTGTGWHGGRAGNVLEWNSPSFIVDVPAAYLDYNSGPLWVRVGQQQIAWGEAYFFRVFDVPNGLDTRRHFTLDVAAEEFADKRVASPAVRASYTFDNGFELDTFVQMFAPTTIVGTNTPYNVVASGFSWSDKLGEFDEARNTLNFGFRLNMPVTDKLTLGVMAVNRRNPDGVVRWDDAPTVLSDGTANPFCFGPNNGTAAILRSVGVTPGIAADTNGNGVDDITELETPLSNGLCGSDATPDPVGTSSWADWYSTSGKSRLNPTEGTLGFLNGGATNASGTNANTLAGANFGLGTPQQLFDTLCSGANGCAPNSSRDPYQVVNARATLDAFYNSFAFPRGYITREFKRESIFGASFNYIFESEPGSWLDQLIVRGEVSYTPDKVFTGLELRGDGYIVEDEVSSALILEKYHNVFTALPATYLVAQWMHKTESDLFGRHLSGMQHDFDDDVRCLPDPALQTDTSRCGRPEGNDSANYVSFAFQQPFPNLIWRADFAMLIDIQGGVLLQPGLRYKPSTDWQFDLYANILQDFSPDLNDDVIETLDFADEVFARVSFYF
ncbi:MAG: hypothetical protein IT493_07855 [Gammaproteobacteria bacterium]|nr:hypothetical protein [Gammaproteobacteria bacterium]